MQRILPFLACVFFTSLAAQQYPFVHYTPREGLANNRARFLFQDSRGKLYISTYGGLSIYDGSRFINYNTNNGLAAGLVNDIVEMGVDSIWLLPNANRVHCLVNGRLKDFIPADKFVPLVNQLIRTNSGYFALADEGLFRLADRKFNKVDLKGLPDTETGKSLTRGVEFEGKLFILSNPGYNSPFAGNLIVYDLAKNQVTAFKTNIRIICLFNAGRDGLWVSATDGFYRLDPGGLGKGEIRFEPLPGSLHMPRHLIPYFIYRDRQGHTWLSSPKGVYRISPDGNTRLFSVENGLSINVQTSVFQDFENNMWFTNEQTGLCKLSNQELAYYPEYKPGLAITDLFIQPGSDSVWFYDGYHKNVVVLLPDGSERKYAFAQAPGTARMVAAKDGYLLSGYHIFKLSTTHPGKANPITTVYTDTTGSTGFTSGLRDRFGNVIAVSGNLVVLSGNNILTEPLHYIADQVTVDPQDRIWTATRSNQLFCFQLSGTGKNARLSVLKTYHKELLPSSPRSIAADRSGNIWIGTRDHGLYCIGFDGLNIRSIKWLTTLNGLSENYISYLFCDRDNVIWACTPSGLDRIQRVGNQFYIENITQGNNLFFPVTRVQQDHNGMLWILSTGGLFTYTPVRPAVKNWKPRISFSRVIISNFPEKVMANGMSLSFKQNNLGVQLSAPSFVDEKQTRFSYLLEGSGNNSWSEPTTSASINLVNLPPGNYTLHAKAIFLHGLYPETVSSFSFSVLPPWWQTWWFKLVLSVFVLALVILAIRYYINRKLELQRVLLEKKQAIEKERTRIATDMHDDLGAGLSRIRFLSETIGMKKQQHLPIEEEISHIRSYSHEMIDKMGEIVWALNEKNDTLSDLLSYTRAYAVEYLQENGIACHVDEPDEIPHLEVSGEFRRNIYLTVKEALHNIVKHSAATGVFIRIRIDDWLVIEVQDNGKGMDENKTRSFGTGMSSMRARILELKGDFEIQNRNGILVNLRVPLKL